MKVGRNDDGWEAAVTDVNLSGRGKELFGGKDVLVCHFDPCVARDAMKSDENRLFTRCTGILLSLCRFLKVLSFLAHRLCAKCRVYTSLAGF